MRGFSLRGAHPPPAGIVIVAVDNYSLGRINSQLPIPLSYYARLLDALHRANPRLIGLDLQFIGASSRPSQDRTLLGAFARDGPVLVSVTDSGTGVPVIAGVSNPRGVVPARTPAALTSAARFPGLAGRYPPLVLLRAAAG
jgi:CHASE2 domain-containing sensor protein